MAAAEHLGQAVIEFDSTATVETVVIDESVITDGSAEDISQETTQESMQEPTDVVSPESGEPADETK